MSDLVGNPEDRFSHNEAHMLNVAVEVVVFIQDNELVNEKTCFLHMRKQRRRSAVR